MCHILNRLGMVAPYSQGRKRLTDSLNEWMTSFIMTLFVEKPLASPRLANKYRYMINNPHYVRLSIRPSVWRRFLETSHSTTLALRMGKNIWLKMMMKIKMKGKMIILRTMMNDKIEDNIEIKDEGQEALSLNA